MKNPRHRHYLAKPWVIYLLIASSIAARPALGEQNPKSQASALRAEGRNYEIGNGVERNSTKAIELYCEAARLGDVEAQYNLGWIYANGHGTAKDDATAAYFFTMSAKQGDRLSERMLRQVGEPVTTPPKCLLDSEDQDIFATTSPKQKELAELVLKLAPEYGVNPRLAMAIIRTESNYNTNAVSAKNAQGLMQLIPETAERFNVKKPFDPEQNIRGGLAYLRWLLAYFKGDVTLVAAGYNAGEGAVNRFRGIPPFPETQFYVKKITEIFKRDDHPFDPKITPPSPDLPKITSRKLM